MRGVGPAIIRWLGVAPAIAIVSIVVWQVIASQTYDSRVASEGDWRRASNYLASVQNDGDLIVCVPRWLDPLCRMHFGEFMSIDDRGRLSSETYGRIWEVSWDGHEVVEAPRATRQTRRSFGKLNVQLLTQPPRIALRDLRTDIGLSTGPGAQVSLQEVGFRPRKCVHFVLWANKPAVFRMKDTPPGELALYLGIADVFTRRDIREPVQLIAAVDGRDVAKVKAGVNDGLVTHVSPVDGAGELTLTITSQARTRRVCLGVQVWGRRGR